MEGFLTHIHMYATLIVTSSTTSQSLQMPQLTQGNASSPSPRCPATTLSGDPAGELGHSAVSSSSRRPRRPMPEGTTLGVDSPEVEEGGSESSGVESPDCVASVGVDAPDSESKPPGSDPVGKMSCRIGSTATAQVVGGLGAEMSGMQGGMGRGRESGEASSGFSP